MHVRRRRATTLALATTLLGAAPACAAHGPAELPLDEAQRDWIARHPVVRWTAIFEAMPYLAYRDGVPRGLVVDLMARVAALTGLRFEYVASATHSGGLQRLSDGSIQLMPVLGRTTERLAQFAFTQAYASFPLGIFTRRRAPYVGEAADLAGRQVAVPFGLDRLIVRAAPDLRLRRVEDLAAAVRALGAGEVDAVIGPVPVLRYWVLRLGADEVWMQGVLMQGAVPVEASLGMAAPRAAAPLVQVLDAALARIHLPERRDLIDAWMQPRPESGAMPRVVMAAGTAAAAAFALGAWAWRRRGRVESPSAVAPSSVIEPPVG